MKGLIWGSLFLIGVQISFAQQKLSPKFNAADYRTTEYKGLLTLSVRDNTSFLKEYDDFIEVKHAHLASGTFSIHPKEALIERFLLDENVLFVDITDTPQEESILDDPDFSINRVRKIQYLFPERSGTSRIVSIKEQQFDTDDIDLRNKAILLGTESATVSQHATAIATIIAGRGNSSPQSKGILPELRLGSSNFTNLLPDDESQLINNNIFVQNHSYGIGIENYYGSEARAYDVSAWTEPTLLHIFSVGNRGQQTPENGTYAGLPFATLTGNFKQAKNVLTIGALDSLFAVSPFNSRGPAFDGRLKPELTAYGGRGTSDAAAMVTGIVAWLQDAYYASFDRIPAASLIKSMLIAGSDDVGQEGIDFYSGYGNVNVSKASKILDEGWFREVQIESHDSISISIVIPQNQSRLKIAVSWIDPPAPVNTDQALINDINARLVHEGNVWLPWVLNASPDITALNSKSMRKEDHLNTTEFITLENPEVGVYSLTLKAGELETPEQTIHISWYLQSDSTFVWDYPTAADILQSNTRSALLWETGILDPSALQFRWMGGEWITQSSDLYLTDLLQWNIPDSSGPAQLRMITPAETFYSDTFMISQVPKVSVSFNCANNLGLEWDHIDGADSYRIFIMDDLLMTEIGQTSGSSFNIEKSAEVFYAVAPVFQRKTGLRSPALDYTFQGTFCYFNFFSAQKLDADRVTLTLKLSTITNIKSLEVFKSFNNDESLLASLKSIPTEELTFYDTEPDPGIMNYRAVLQLTDGSTISSDTIGIFIEKVGEAILFPNPSSEGFINVLSSGEETIEILDRSGKLLLEKQLSSKLDFVIIEDLRAGLYFFRLKKEGEVIDSGKFIKY